MNKIEFLQKYVAEYCRDEASKILDLVIEIELNNIAKNDKIWEARMNNI